jgi:hypothetical protein
MSATPPAPLGPDWKPWGERLVSYMTRVRSQLATFVTGDKATDNGILVWDRTGYPVVSKNGEFRQIVLADGYAQFIRTTNQQAATINTAYGIAWDTMVFGDGITLDPTDNTKIVFPETGKFILSFSAELKSSSSSTKTIWIWPRINGVDANGATMKTTLHTNNQDLVVSRVAIFEMQAGQYLQAMFAVDDVDIWLDAPAATAFAPSAPAATLSITRYMQ